MGSYGVQYTLPTDRSGPFERSGHPQQYHDYPTEFVSGYAVPQDAVYGYAPSMTQVAAPAVVSHPQADFQGHRRARSSLHQLELNPFESSFQNFARAANAPTAPMMNSRKRSCPSEEEQHHQIAAIGVNKRPKLNQLQHTGQGSGTESGSHQSSFGTAKSTSTDSASGTDTSRRNSPIDFNPYVVGSDSAYDTMSLKMAKSLSTGDALAYASTLNKSVPATARDYEQLVRAYAQNNATQAYTQPPPKALPVAALQQYRPAPMGPSSSVSVPQIVQPAAGAPVVSHPAASVGSAVPMPTKASHYPATADEQLMPDDLSDEFDPRLPASVPQPVRKQSKKKAKVAKPQQHVQQLALEAIPMDADEERRAQFLERNRVAACKSRQKKKEWIAGLEATSEDLTRKNSDMQATIAALRDEVTNLRGALAAHASCSCKGASQQSHELANMEGKAASRGAQHSCPSQTQSVASSSAASTQSGSPNQQALLSPAPLNYAQRPLSFSPVSYLTRSNGEQDYFSQLNTHVPSNVINTPDLASQLGF